MGQLDGQVAMVTGGARGMGRSHAVGLARQGADVVLLDTCQDVDWAYYRMARPEDLAETATLVEKEGRRCLARQADVRDIAAVQGVVDDARAEFGRLDILVANAGITGVGAIQNATAESWHDIIATNLTGTFNSFRVVAPVMIEQRYGRMVGISSMMGRTAAPAIGAYTASKWGVIGLVKSAAQDLAAWGITVNAIAPGNIRTPMIDNDGFARLVRPDLAEPTLADTTAVLGAMHVQPEAVLPPEDVTDAILFLVGAGARHITGAVIDVSAGASARFTA